MRTSRQGGHVLASLRAGGAHTCVATRAGGLAILERVLARAGELAVLAHAGLQGLPRVNHCFVREGWSLVVPHFPMEIIFSFVFARKISHYRLINWSNSIAFDYLSCGLNHFFCPWDWATWADKHQVVELQACDGI
jgi:hypothetical protein